MDGRSALSWRRPAATPTASLLGGVRLPNVEQSKVLLRNGLGETFWNTLTITGKIEAKGRLLAEMQFPDMQQFIVEDIWRWPSVTSTPVCCWRRTRRGWTAGRGHRWS